MNGTPSEKHYYLFNGDFVDRGNWSTEIALVLYAPTSEAATQCLLHKPRQPQEQTDMNRVYGFEGECKAKYNEGACDNAQEPTYWAFLL